ncbi:helix-turn-helix domain-containing protein [Liquorilactobacillus mali]|uniref:winged helix-turn-helix transcriptional regulator n=1 Tax=Liquorilactobacillus mali TaxID=1618 RepID=UPI0009EC6809|nr:helix-turn-helix domain-containing protein [Liquorilactobacillus mali]MDN7145423.1 helix-turn-helix domain-containing protein [Liquorilactobacillus mali]
MQKTYRQLLQCNCSSANTMALIGGKWKVIVLDHLHHKDYHFNELQRSINGITPHTLSQILKELAKDDLVKRHDFKTIPPQTVYSLSSKGKELIPLLNEITKFGKNHPLQ